MSGTPLLDPCEGAPIALENSAGQSPVILVCEHASKTIPAALNGLGLASDARDSHAAWDIGALALARRMSALLDAPLIWQRFSRLVYDCNRPPEAADAIPPQSEVFAVPGNVNLTPEARAQRVNEIYLPFQQSLAKFIDSRASASPAPVIVTVHSFTKIYNGAPRDGALGVLHGADARLADAVLAAAPRHGLSDARRNYPYGPQDGVMHTLDLQAGAQRYLNVMLEVRNDLITEPDQQDAWAQTLTKVLLDSLRTAAKTQDANLGNEGPCQDR